MVEKELRVSEEKYRLLIENSSEAIFIIINGKVKYANVKTQQMTGYDAEELSKFSFINMVVAEDRNMVLERQKSSLQTEHTSINFSFRLADKAGTTHWVETNSVGINWDNCPALLNSMRDISRQKKLKHVSSKRKK